MRHVDIGRIFVKDKTKELHSIMECHGQNSELVHSRINLEEYVKKMFFEEHTAHQMKENWKLSYTKFELFDIIVLDEVKPSSPSIQ
jgi:hypothetical protein